MPRRERPDASRKSGTTRTPGTVWTNDQARMEALTRLRVLDTPAEEAFDRFTRVAARLLDMPMSLVSLIDDHRQWFKSAYGLPIRETDRRIAFCDHTIRGSDPMVVRDALADPRFADNPLVTGAPNIRFYAGAPLVTADGIAIGTLCVLDQSPRPEFDTDQAQLLADLAHMVMERLEVRCVVAAMEDEVVAHRNTEEALRRSLTDREQLLREIHHRVKNNLQAIGSIVQVEGTRMAPGTGCRIVLDAIGERIAVMFRIHQTLYTTEHLDRIEVGQQILQIAHRLVQRHGMERQVAVEARCAQLWLDSDTALRVALIANELIDNALIHGRPAQGAGSMTLRLDGLGETGLRLVVENGGPAAPAPEGVGLMLVRALAHQLEADFQGGPGGAGWRAVLDLPHPGPVQPE